MSGKNAICTKKACWKKALLIVIVFGGLIAIGVGSYTILGIMNIAKQQAANPPQENTIYPPYPQVDYGSGEKATLIKRGEYLAKAGDCIACHTAPHAGAKPFAGNYPVDTPFGTIYTPNITMDKATGLGNWTEAQFEKAMRQGIAKDGSYYYPAFPYPYFNRLKDDDVKAIWSYLQALPQQQEVKKDNSMIFPFNIRLMQLGWRILFFEFSKKGAYQIDKAQSAAWNKGAYLVEGLGHCAMCHTPSYYIGNEKFSLAAPRVTHAFTGAHVVGYYAPAINHDALSAYANAEILKVFKQDEMLGGGEVIGPMKEVNHNSLRYLTRADLSSMVDYLKSVNTKPLPAPEVDKNNLGEGIYEAHCAACHATGAGGAPKYGDAGAWAARAKQGEDTLVHNAIQGIRGMPAKGACPTCSDAEIKSAVLYLLGTSEGEPSANPISLPAPAKPLTLDEGKRIYETHCSVCHAKGFKGAPVPGDKKAWVPIVDEGFTLAYIHALQGYHDHPPRGSCSSCSGAEIKAAVKYMMQQSTDKNDYRLW